MKVNKIVTVNMTEVTKKYLFVNMILTGFMLCVIVIVMVSTIHSLPFITRARGYKTFFMLN